MLETTLEQYFQEGKQEGLLEALSVMLESRFGKLTDKQLSKLKELSPDKLKQIFAKLWSVKSLDDIFND